MIQKVSTRKMHRKNSPLAVLTVNKVYTREETAAFLKQWEEVTKQGSKHKSVILNNEYVKFEGFVRKTPRIVNIPKAVRKVIRLRPESNKNNTGGIEVKILLNQSEMYDETENILRAIIDDTFGRYVTYDKNQVSITNLNK